MKIGFDGRFIRQGQTGNGVFTQNLLEGMANIDNENEYTVYLLENNNFIRKDNFHLKRMSSLHSNSQARFLLTFPMELMRNPVDIFHAIYTIPLLPFKTSTRIILTLVEFSWFLNPEDFPASRLFLSQVRTVTRYSINRADLIITPTQIGKEQVVEYFDLPEEKVEVIPFGFNEKFLELCEPEKMNTTKQKYGISGPYILSVGDLHPRKNLFRLIEAFNWLKETRKIPHQLVLAGKALYQAEEIYQKASSCKARDSIIFTGYVTFEELRGMYQGASVFAFPSLDEGFGLPVHEAMACRVPVIASDRGALPEVADDAAVFVDPLDVEDIGSGILRILESPSLREELIKKGLNQIKGFLWDKSCWKLLHLYQEISQKGNGDKRT
jgi:glycosyltransferase involved in cell wall biosynthesis